MFAERHVLYRTVRKGQVEGGLLVNCRRDRTDIRVVAEDTEKMRLPIFPNIAIDPQANSGTPPLPRGYLRPFIVWGPIILLSSLWTFVGFRSILELSKSTMIRLELPFVFLLLTVASLAGLVINLRKVAHYNREVFPRLHWNWEHTYICRRCGKFRLIPSEL